MVNETPKGETRQSALTATARPAVSRSVKGVNLQWRPDQLWTELHGRLSSGRMPDANGPNVPRLRRTLLVDETSLVLGSRPRGGNREFWVVTVVSCEADPLPPPRRVAIDRLR